MTAGKPKHLSCYSVITCSQLPTIDHGHLQTVCQDDGLLSAAHWRVLLERAAGSTTPE